MILTRARILLILLILCGVAGTLYLARDLWLGGGEIGIAPHQALYAMNMTRLRQANTIADVRGQMFYRIEDACDGWNVAQKFNLQFVYTEAPSALITSDYNTYESKDGRRYQFSTRRFRDSQLTDEILGKAERKDTAGNGTITYQRPKSVEAAIPANVLFPTQHTLEILRNAASGQKWFNSPLFDGSDLSIATDVNGFILKKNKPYVVRVEEVTPVVASPDDDVATASEDDLAPGPKPMTAESLNAHPLISGTRAWQLRLAFYPRDQVITPEPKDGETSDDPAKSLTPDYEMTMVLHSDGVVSAFTLDYPDFSLDAHLLSIAEVARNSC